MCCLFTCCGWMIDLVQRVWVFAMSCCIGSAVCCVLLTSSMSGVALGYNYSLAEYIDTKETNVSVYLKRGVFDDEMQESQEWRRRGGGNPPPRGLLSDDGDFKTAPPEEVGPDEIPPRSGRRLDDTILETNDNNRFEGSLMRLTAVSPPYPGVTTTPFAIGRDMANLQEGRHPPLGSIDHLKDIQTLINRRKMEAAREPTIKGDRTMPYDESKLAHAPGYPMPVGDLSRRVMSMMGRESDPDLVAAHRMQNDVLPRINPARFAVPDPHALKSEMNWLAPKLPEAHRRLFTDDEFLEKHTYPQPIPLNTGPVRPPTSAYPSPTVTNRMHPTMRSLEPGVMRLGDKYDVGRMDENYLPARPGPGKPGGKSDSEYYDEDVKGLPARRRRRSLKITTHPELHDTITQITKPETVNERLSDIITTTFELRTKDTNQVKTEEHKNALNVRKTISNEIRYYPSILVRKLQSPNTGHIYKSNVENRTESSERKIISPQQKINSSTINKMLRVVSRSS